MEKPNTHLTAAPPDQVWHNQALPSALGPWTHHLSPNPHSAHIGRAGDFVLCHGHIGKPWRGTQWAPTNAKHTELVGSAGLGHLGKGHQGHVMLRA